MPWPKTFPNPEWVKPTDSQWRPVAGRPGMYVHDDVPTQIAEIILYQCPTCGHEQQTIHSVGPTPAAQAAGIMHEAATPEARQAHSICPQNHAMVPITLAQSRKDKLTFGRDTIGIGRT